MSLSADIGLLLTAGLLGVTHGIEPDHVAGVAALTHEAGSTRLSAVVGACFAAGHVALVVLWVGLAYLFVNVSALPAGWESFTFVVVGAALALLGLLLGVAGAQKLIHRHEHDHDGGPHAHVHLHLPSPLRPNRERGSKEIDDGGDNRERRARDSGLDEQHDHGEDHEHSHSVAEFLKLGLVGALFTLSPPLSMLAFISLTLAEANTLLVGLVVVAYAVSITATMTAVAGGAGALFRASKARGESVHAASQLVAAVAVLGVALGLLAEHLPAVLSA